jgi:glutathione S-transferase
MKLHWSPKSPYVRKVMVCAHELGLIDQLVLVRSVASMLSPNSAIMQDNPLNKIPTLVLGPDQSLFDSRVICEYLDALAQGTLFSKVGEYRWQALRWQAFGDGLLDVLILWRNEREKLVPLPALINAFELKVMASLEQLEKEVAHLRDKPFSIGQIAIFCALGYVDFRFANISWRTAAPNLAAWFLELSERPSLRATHPDFD